MARGTTKRLSDANIASLRPRDREYTVWDARVPGLGVRVRSSGHRSYVYLVSTGGGTRRCALGSAALQSVDDVRHRCLEMAASATDAGGQPAEGGGPGRSAPTFADFVAGPWHEACYKRYKPATRKGVDGALRRQLLPSFGTLSLDRITGRAVLWWFDTYSRTAPGGANDALKIVKQIMNHAVAVGIIRRSPARSVKRNPRPKLTRFLSQTEVRRLREALDERAARRQSNRPAADIIRLLLLTGCRMGEILWLQWPEVDHERQVLNLTDSKTGPRTVWLSIAAQEILARQPKTASPWIFPSPSNSARSRLNVDAFWRSVRKQAGIEDVRLHDLRHTFASHAVLRGVPLPTVSRLLGHRNASMTLRYAHVSDCEVEAAAERIGTAIARLIADSAGGDAPESASA